MADEVRLVAMKRDDADWLRSHAQESQCKDGTCEFCRIVAAFDAGIPKRQAYAATNPYLAQGSPAADFARDRIRSAFTSQ